MVNASICVATSIKLDLGHMNTSGERVLSVVEQCSSRPRGLSRKSRKSSRKKSRGSI